MLYRLILAIALALGIVAFVGATAWAKPYSDAEMRDVETSQEAQIRDLRNQEITQLRIALGRRIENNRRADLYFRLAEIYLEAYRTDYLIEGRVHEKRLEKGIEDQKIDHTHSHPHLDAGIKVSNEILRLKIPYAKLDQVYFFLGFNYAELGKEQDSLRYFEALTRNFPNSAFAGEAYRVMGDAAFVSNNFRKAQGYYELAVSRSAESSKPQILHKLAWNYYRLRQFDRSIATMKEAIALANKQGEKFLNLREEALRDMAVFMTEAGRVDEAIAYFQTVAGDKSFYPKVLERLGKQYERNVEPAKATQVYESLLKTNPETESAFRVLVKLVDLDLRRGRQKEALSRLGKDFEAPSGGENETQVASQNLRAMIRRTATESHAAYRKKGEKPSLEVAELYYGAYLDKFLAKDDPRGETPEIQMYLAEVKRDLGKSREASALYRKVVESRDKRYAKEAGALWTASLADAIQKQGKKAAGAAEPSELEHEFVEAADQLAESLGETNEARESSLRATQVLAGYKATQGDAIKRIRKIISTWPKSVQALTAARLWVQLIADRNDGDSASDMKDAMVELRENSVLMGADKELGGAKLASALAEQETRLKIGAIASAEKEKDFEQAGKGYEQLATESAQRDLAEKAYENAVGSYLKESNLDAAMRVASNWLKRYPKSPRALDSVRYAATANLIQGRFDMASKLFEKIGREGGDPDSLETAARIAEADGDAIRAQQLWAAYLTTYPKSSSRARVALTLGRSQEASHQDGEAVRSYRACIAGSDSYEEECAVRLAALYASIGNSAEHKKLLEQVAKSKKSSPYVGYARFQLAEMMEKEAKFEALQLPEAQLKKGLSQRLSFLESLSRAYNSAVDAGGPWAIAALDRLALWAMNFADEVDRIPGSDEFRKNLASVSGPLRKKALSTWNDSYQKALAAEVLSPALPEIADRLSIHAQGYAGHFATSGDSATPLPKVREKLSKNPQDAQAWFQYGSHLWDEGKKGLASIAFDRAAALNPKSPQFLNNRAVALLETAGADDWLRAAEASALLKTAMEADPFYVVAKSNRAKLLNYYRLFQKSKPLWEQIDSRMKDVVDASYKDGYAIALQALGDAKRAQAEFVKATQAGASGSRFSAIYHEAARLKGAECVSKLGDLDESSLTGFEKAAVQTLKETCQR